MTMMYGRIAYALRARNDIAVGTMKRIAGIVGVCHTPYDMDFTA